MVIVNWRNASLPSQLIARHHFRILVNCAAFTEVQRMMLETLKKACLPTDMRSQGIRVRSRATIRTF